MVPPLAATVFEYVVLIWPSGKEDVVICTGVIEAATVTLRLAVSVFAGELESVTRTVNEAVPEAVGVPLIWPAPFRFNPAGTDPEANDQL